MSEQLEPLRYLPEYFEGLADLLDKHYAGDRFLTTMACKIRDACKDLKACYAPPASPDAEALAKALERIEPILEHIAGKYWLPEIGPAVEIAHETLAAYRKACEAQRGGAE